MPVSTVGYFPYSDAPGSVEAGWLAEHLSLDVRTARAAPSLNACHPGTLPAFGRVSDAVAEFLALPAVVAEGPGGFVWAALLRAHGFAGTVTVLPYLNVRGWYDVAAAALYRRFAVPGDRVFLGSAPSAAVYRAVGIQASVGEPYGIDDRLFRFWPEAAKARDQLSIPRGRLLVFAGRAEPDKDIYRLLRAGLKARVLFPDLQVVIASHVVDSTYMMAAREQLGTGAGVYFVRPTREQLAGLYNAADVFVTASTSHFETFGRAPAEALACGCPVVAPRYDGFVEVLAQPGGMLVDVEFDSRTGAPHVHEELLLRAVYDVLSSPRPPPRRQIAATARRRFGRSAAIGLLGYLAGGAPSEPAALPPAHIQMPSQWRPPLAEIASRDALDAVAWFWDGCDHDRFAAHDHEFAAAVRRSLCTPKPRSTDGTSECL